MNTQQQAYINGFVKRAAEYGYSRQQAESILKHANMAAARTITPLRGALSSRERDYDRIVQEQIAYNNQNPVNYATSRPATDTQKQRAQAGLGHHTIDSTGRGVRYNSPETQTALAPAQAQQSTPGYTQSIGPVRPPASEGYDYPIGPTQPDNFMGTNLTGNQPSMSPPAALMREMASRNVPTLANRIKSN